MLSRDVGRCLDSYPDKSLIDRRIVDDFHDADFVVGNLENPIAVKGAQYKPTAFKAHPSVIPQLKPFNFLSLANNHIFDCGTYGIQETLGYLKGRDILYNGISDGGSIFPEIVSIKGAKIAFLSCLDFNCKGNYDEKGPFHPNLAYSEQISEIIEVYVPKVDYFIVLLHGGEEMIPFPPPDLRRLCKSLIDKGVSLVVTHHPHVLGGMEDYNKGKIFYSLGDFIFDGESYLRRQSGYLKICLTAQGTTWDLVPTVIQNDLTVNRAHPPMNGKIIKKYQTVSNKLKSGNYDSLYVFRYWVSFLYFQYDRIYFQIKNQGVVYTLKSVMTKIRLIPYYLKKLIAKSDSYEGDTL